MALRVGVGAAVVKLLWTGAASARPAALVIPVVSDSTYIWLGTKSESGAKKTRSPSRLRSTFPRTRVVPVVSPTVAVSTVAGVIGSLNTTTMVALSGTSRPPDGGLVRTTLSGRADDTASRTCASAAAAAPVMSTARVSAMLAASGTGSNPPSTTGVVTY